VNPLHERLIRCGLEVAERYQFALAGGHALRAHGLGERPCDDIELLTPRVTGVAEALPGIVAAYVAENGLKLEVELAGGSFARLRILVSNVGTDTKLKLGVDQRVYPAALLDLGPVLSADDAVAGAMVALLGRHLAEDFIDVDHILRSRHYTRADLLDLAGRHDPGFDIAHFCEALDALRSISDLAFAHYGLTTTGVTALRGRFAGWQRELIATWLSSW
jgi:hypothetical protein